jgi:hypothetical protein
VSSEEQHTESALEKAELPAHASNNAAQLVLFCCYGCMCLFVIAQAWAASGKKGVWLKVPRQHSHLIPAAVEPGFVFHHAEQVREMYLLLQRHACHHLLVSPVRCCVMTSCVWSVGLCDDDKVAVTSGQHLAP